MFMGRNSKCSGRNWASLETQVVKNPPLRQESWVRVLGGEDPPEKEMAMTPVFWPGESHGQRSLAGYSSRGRKRVGPAWREHSEYTAFMHLRIRMPGRCARDLPLGDGRKSKQTKNKQTKKKKKNNKQNPERQLVGVASGINSPNREFYWIFILLCRKGGVSQLLHW